MPLRLLLIFFVTFYFGFVRADYGDRPVDWTAKDTAIFQDYAIRALNAKSSIKNNYWAHYWLSEKLNQFQLSEMRLTNTPTPLLIDQNSINAFALPGNLIGIHTGLWRFAQSEDELLSVLAHEMGHISLDHFTRLSADRAQKGWLIASGIVLSFLLANENPEAANAALLSSFAAASQQNLSFSQAMELEADQFGQDLLKHLGYEPHAGRHFFTRLDQQTFANTQTEFLRSHPLGSTRASKLSSAEKQSPSSEQPKVFDFINLLVLQHDQNGTFEFLKRTLAERSLTPVMGDDPHLEYALALFALTQDQKQAPFLERLSQVTNRFPNYFPAWHKRLEVALEINSKDKCEVWQNLPAGFAQSNLSLDALETIAQGAQHCQPIASVEWQARYFWRSGQEEKAMSLLRNSIIREQNTNQLARLKNQLNTFNERYERLR
ncbi:M48 family metallopeptidase [Reinekea marina]|uniref:M48 family metallopeptidase n=1 Tax=Reinekea marina TaxID=1310421 RepID=A0ABV7WSW0_9GAMM|nr:M48 family metallopeptidase [Reinekea marina]MDN3650264.1 M48 family metallopeptidase [Reinekea marina]